LTRRALGAWKKDAAAEGDQADADQHRPENRKRHQSAAARATATAAAAAARCRLPLPLPPGVCSSLMQRNFRTRASWDKRDVGDE
jgi:hypothetical protein